MNESKNEPLPPLFQKTPGATESSRPRAAETAPNSDEEPEQDFMLNEDNGPDDKSPDLRTATLRGRSLYKEKDVSEWPFKRPAEVGSYETTKYPGGSFKKPIYEPGSHMLFDARVGDMDPTRKNEPLASRGPERPMEQMNKRTKQETDEDNERIPFNVLTKQTIKFEDVTSENVREVIKTAISKQLGISLITGHLVKISEKMATGKIKLNIMCRTPCVHGSDNPKDKCSFSITGQMLGLKPEAGNVKSVEMELRARGEHSDGAIGKWRNIKNPHAAKRQHLADPKTGEKI